MVDLCRAAGPKRHPSHGFPGETCLSPQRGPEIPDHQAYFSCLGTCPTAADVRAGSFSYLGRAQATVTRGTQARIYRPIVAGAHWPMHRCTRRMCTLLAVLSIVCLGLADTDPTDLSSPLDGADGDDLGMVVCKKWCFNKWKLMCTWASCAGCPECEDALRGGSANTEAADLPPSVSCQTGEVTWAGVDSGVLQNSNVSVVAICGDVNGITSKTFEHSQGLVGVTINGNVVGGITAGIAIYDGLFTSSSQHLT